MTPTGHHPSRVGGYTLTALIGSGAFGDTYLAEDLHGARVAVKLLKREHLSDPRTRERFKRELEAGHRLSSHYFARVLDWDVSGADAAWIAFTYVEGRGLRDAIAEGPLPDARVVRIARQFAEALKVLAQARLVHRDLKPDNVRLGPNDSVTVLDLGVAGSPEWSTLTAAEVGTYAYMAPEQFAGGPAAPAMDVWAFGLMLAELAGGLHPLARDMGSLMSLVQALSTGRVDLSRVPEPWHGTARACLALRPEDRPSPEDLVRQIDSIAVTAPARTPGASAAQSLQQALASARAAIDQMGSEEDRAVALAALAEALTAAKDSQGARAAIRTARALADSLKDPEDAYVAIAQAQAAAGDVRAAFATVDLLEGLSGSIRAWEALRAIATAQAAAGDLRAAQATFAAARDYVEDLYLPADPRYGSWIADIAAAQAAAGDLRGARANMEDAVSFAASLARQRDELAGTGEELDIVSFEEWRADMLGDFARARASIDAAIAGAQAAVGDIRSARITADAVNEPVLRSYALTAISAAMAAAGDQRGAHDTITAARADLSAARADAYSPGWATPTRLCQIAEAMAAAGDHRAAHDTIRAAQSTTGDHPYWRVIHLCQIAKAWAVAV